MVVAVLVQIAMVWTSLFFGPSYLIGYMPFIDMTHLIMSTLLIYCIAVARPLEMISSSHARELSTWWFTLLYNSLLLAFCGVAYAFTLDEFFKYSLFLLSLVDIGPLLYMSWQANNLIAQLAPTNSSISIVNSDELPNEVVMIHHAESPIQQQLFEV
jgi:hypothetical protein